MTGALATNDVALRRTVLSNGLTVLSEHMPGVRSVALGAWVRAASVHESPRTMGLSHLLEHMVFKGTQRRSAKDIALALESVGGSLDAYTSREHTSYQARVLDEHVEIAADVLADLIFRPLLRTTDLEMERKVVLEEISTVEDTPDDMVFELHGARLWGDHPYGYPILGTRETVSSFTSADLETLHRRAYHPEHIVVAASGNIEHDDLIQILETAGWTSFPSGGQSRLASTPAVPALPTTTHFNREGAQTHVVFGTATMPHGDPRRYAMALVSTLLGGGMSSRLFQRVREELGLAYSVYSFQSFHHDAGVSGVYVGTAPDTAALATEAIVEELDRVAKEGLPDDEIAAGKNQLKGQITLSLESVSSRMYRAAGVELYDEEFRSLDEVLALIDSIDRDSVLAVCRDFFAPEVQTIVSLGPGGSTRIPSINNEN
ncbi:MAG TPA: pitrilysin family protein [Gemmatimonadaceae bacterium]|nr:pitrilysin family protein [Gemmatimonadaceae bacterium]